MVDAFDTPPEMSYVFPVKTPTGYRLYRTNQPAWPALEALFKTHQIKRPLAFLPPELQLDTLFLHAARHTNIPATSGSVFDVGWSVAAAAAISIDCLVTEARVLPFIAEALSKAGLSEQITMVVVIDGKSPYPTLAQAPHYNLPHPLLEHV